MKSNIKSFIVSVSHFFASSAIFFSIVRRKNPFLNLKGKTPPKSPLTRAVANAARQPFYLKAPDFIAI